MKKLLLIVTLLFAFGITNNVMAQAKGGRKREHKNQHRGGGFGGFKVKHSGGHADMFARGGQRGRGFFAKIFGGKQVTAGGWVYKPTRPGAKQKAEQHQLFTRFRTKNKKMKDGMQARINKARAKGRGHGSASFSKRRY